MSKNINLGTINAETVEILSGYYHAVITGKARRAELKKAIAEAEEGVQAVKDARAEAMEQGMTADDAIRAHSMTDANAALAEAEDNYNEGCKALRLAQAKATKLVPDSLFEGYQNRKADRAGYIKALAEFLAELGLAGTERGVEKVGEGISDYLFGGRKATGKKLEDGHVLADWTKASFRDMVIRAFIEYALFEKGVFDKDENSYLTLHKFEEESKEEGGLEPDNREDEKAQEVA